MAITRHKLVELVLADNEDGKGTLNRVIIEPYALGFNKDKEMILVGRKTDVKLEQPKMEDEKESAEENNGQDSGSTMKAEVENIVDIKVLRNEDFVPDKDILKEANENLEDIICVG
jgi:hypothetical protein